MNIVAIWAAWAAMALSAPHIQEPSIPPAPPERTVSLTVEVDQLRNSKGRVQFALYNRDGSIPDEHYERCCKRGTAPIVGGKATYTFTGLPPGRYAVNILHDENGNGKIDKGLLLPKEGIGFSKYSTIGLGNRPNFRKANFEVEQDLRIRVQVVYL